MPKAEKRAERLLREFLLPEQEQDWEKDEAFNVRGSDGKVYRLCPGGGHYGGYVVGDQSANVWNLTNVWPVGLAIAADRALAMMLYVMDDASLVYSSGCHDAHPIELSTYGGKI
jgi:hypothetical protein